MQRMAADSVPRWFTQNLDNPGTSKSLRVDGCDIHYLHWPCSRAQRTTGGKRASIFFLHGNGANAHWWAFLAPFFARDYDCFALSNSGSGQSGWRDQYTFEGWAGEVHAVAQAEDTLDQTRNRAKPIIIAHSMGVIVALALAELHGSSYGGAVLVDEVPRPPGYFSEMPDEAKGLTSKPAQARPPRPYSDSPRAKFRLIPPQRVQNQVRARARVLQSHLPAT